MNTENLTAASENDVDQLAKDFDKLEKRKKTRSILLKLLLGLGVLVLVLVVLCLIFKLDSRIFPTTISGKVSDSANVALAGVNVCIANKCVVTDVDGAYTMTGLVYGDGTITGELPGYEKYSTKISLQRGSNTADFSLKALGTGNISGKLITAQALDDTDLVINFADQLVSLNSDQTFNISNKTVGTYTLQITSPAYLDITQQVEVKEGGNEIPEITLQPAMDIRFEVDDWLKASPLSVYTATVGNAIFTADTAGQLIISDQAYSKDLKFYLKSDGYTQKLISLSDLVQGMNDVGPFSLVKSGKVAYVSDVLGYDNIYVANYDGSSAVKITDNKADSSSPELLSAGTAVGFLSSQDKLVTSKAESIFLPYSYDLSSGTLKKIVTSDYSGGLIGYYSFAAMQRAYVETNNVGGANVESIYVGTIDSNSGTKVAEMTSGYVTGIKFSPTAGFIIFSWSNYGAVNNEVFKVDLASNTVNKIYDAGSKLVAILDIAPDATTAVIKVTDENNTTSDLYQINLGTDKISRLTNTTVAEHDVRYSPNGSYVYYALTRENATDIYRVNSNGENEVRVTTVGSVSSFQLLNDQVLCFTSKGSLYVLDVTKIGYKPQLTTAKVVADSFNTYGDYYDN